MSKSPFESSAIAWLRDTHHVDLPPVPPTRPQASARRTGEILAHGPAGKWGFGGLLLITIGAVFSLVASRPGMGTTVTEAMKWSAWAALAIGLGAIVHAWRNRGRSRPVCVHFVVGGKTPRSLSSRPPRPRACVASSRVAPASPERNAC